MIVTVQLNVPVLLVSPQLVVESVSPDSGVSVIEIVAVEEVGVNPVPLTVTDVPLGPWLGVSVIVGVVIVNEAVATLLELSVAVIVYGVAEADPERTNVHPENDPPVSTVQEDTEETVAPVDAVNVTVALGANPVPEAPTVRPLGPWLGVSASVGSGAMESVSAAHAADDVNVAVAVNSPGVAVEAVPYSP